MQGCAFPTDITIDRALRRPYKMRTSAVPVGRRHSRMPAAVDARNVLLMGTECDGIW